MIRRGKIEDTRLGHPLLPLACALIAGVWLASRLVWPWAFWGGAALACLAAAVLGSSRGGPWGRLLWPLVFLAAGGFLFSLAGSPGPGPTGLLQKADGRLVRLDAVVVSAPQPYRHGWSFLARARSVDGKAAGGKVRLRSNGRLPRPRVGWIIKARLRLKPFTNYANPGGFDYQAHMAEKGLWLRGYLGMRSGMALSPPRGGVSLRLVLEKVRERVSGLLLKLKPGPGRALLRGLVLGQRGELSPRHRRAFAASGTAHLLAVSGLHLGLIWGGLFFLLRYAGAAWPRLALNLPLPKLAAGLALAGAAVYAGLAGLATPTVRALVMISALVAAGLVNRPYNPLGALALAGLLITLFWPAAPFSASFQLSFIAVGSILLAGVPLAVWVKRRKKWWAGLVAWLGVSFVVGLAVMPLTMHYFHQAPLLFLPANALLVPLVGVITLPLALAGALLGLIWPWAGEAVLSLAQYPAAWGVRLAHWFSAPSWAAPPLAGPGVLPLVALYGGLALALAFKSRAWAKWLGGGSLALAVLLVLVATGRPAADGRLSAWVLDVGQGNAVVLRLPRGQVVVVDGGPAWGGGAGAGRLTVAPFLWHLGFSRVNGLAASHADSDHAGGLPFLARAFKPSWIWVNRLDRAARKKGFIRMAQQAGAKLSTRQNLAHAFSLGGARVRVLWPPKGPAADRLKSNDASLWLGFGLGRAWLWLPGDAGPAVEREILPRLPGGGNQVLVAPHHGAATSCTRQLLARIKPGHVIFSAGCGNRYGMPRPGPLRRARRAGAKILSTARQGAVFLSTSGGPWRVRVFLPRPRRCPQRR